MKWFAIILVAMSPYNCFAQNDIAAHFPGGDVAYNEFLETNLQYPQVALDSQASREIRCLVQIDTSGRASLESFIFQNSGLGFEEEVIRFIREMPNWVPAMHNGIVAQSQIILTFTFNYVDPDLDYRESTYKYYLDSDVLPEFVGGIDSISTFIKAFLKDSLLLHFDTAIATLSIMVSDNGEVIDGEILATNNAVADGYWVYACKKMPFWIPGRIKGKPVYVRRELSFILISD